MLFNIMCFRALVVLTLTCAAGVVLCDNFATFSKNLEEEVHHQCIQKCPLQNRSASRHYSLACGFECNIIELCATGCKLWKKALDSSCQSICNGTSSELTSKELYCVMSCNNAVTIYFSKLKHILGIPPPPVLVADSLTATSLSLEWNFKEAKNAGLNTFVQWVYEEHATAPWQYCQNETWITDDTVYITGLQPYTKYRFRVAMLMFSHSEPFVSVPSVVISTLPAGKPASPPAILRAVAVDSTSISVSWEPGPFPHGPLLSYVLSITDNYPQGYSSIKDIPAEKHFYMFRNLQPARNYTLSINMRNGVGSGPSAQILVSTPDEQIAVRNTQQPVLILGASQAIIQQWVTLLDDPILLYNTTAYIKGIAIHIQKKLLFISDSKGYVYRKHLSPYSEAVPILAPNHINFLPLDLSVDWLNDQLYILGKVTHQEGNQVWQISRCNLDGRAMTVAVAGLRYQPHHIEVDPYNGFLFWAIHEFERGALYRLDIADISNGIKHEVIPQLILEDSNLGTFSVDHTNFRLLVCNQSTVNSVSLDGENISNLRPKIIKSRLQNVVSIAMTNGKFYWTTGADVLYEEYHPQSGSYYHNSYPDLTNRKYFKVLVNLPSSQPIPVPMNPPTSVQAIFSFTLAKTTWQVPHLLGGQGKGAWQNWSYELQIKDNNQTSITHKNIATNSYTVLNLDEDTEYIIKVAAYTSSGQGPWSSEFRGKALRRPSDGRNPYILWSGKEGLLRSDITGENVEVLIHSSIFKDHYIVDIAWYKDMLYLVSNTSKLYWFNLSNHEKGQLHDVDTAGNIAIDWIGKKMYWSNPKQQLIIRGNLNGTQQEPLPILTPVKELEIDTARAYLYWSTGQGVECARLNGADRIIYQKQQIFSAVMGLTLDTEQLYVYWVVRSADGSNLHRAPMAGAHGFVYSAGVKPPVETVSALQKPMQGPLYYFSDHLLWLEDNTTATIGDMNAKNTAIVNGKSLYGLNMIYVLDSSLQTWNGFHKTLDTGINVIPEPVRNSTIKVNGTWQKFNITWKPIQNVNYGDIFYELKVELRESHRSEVDTRKTNAASVRYWRNVKPFTKLVVTMRSYTYWGWSSQITAEINSPVSKPSEPVDPRVFISHTDNKLLGEFRWNEPIHPNGPVEGYRINCWYKAQDETIYAIQNVTLKPKEKKYVTDNLLENTKHYFQVFAFTKAGDGESSEIISFDTSTESPLPKLLIASTDSIILEDIDANKTDTLIHSVNSPIEIAYNFREDKLFWINNAKELLMLNSTLASRQMKRIQMLNGQAISLTLDWLERSIYYVQFVENLVGSAVYKLDLNQLEKGISFNQQIFRTPNIILKIEVSPFTRKLYWIEETKDEKRAIKQSNIDGTDIKTFFSEYRLEQEIENDSCNCPLFPLIERTFTIDHSNSKTKPDLIFIESVSQNITVSDSNGCMCATIVEGNKVNNPFKALKADFATLYWIHPPKNTVYAYNKNNTDVKSKEYQGLMDISIWGSHVQPYPRTECITPQDHRNLTVSLVSRTSDSLQLTMPAIYRHQNCLNTSLATVEYTIYYMPYFEDAEDAVTQCNENCSNLTTFSDRVQIIGLRPFSKYIVSVSLSNFYSDLDNTPRKIGPGVVLQTAPGAPSKPENVKAIALNPTIIQVQWQPPKELNGESVRYEIHWQTEGSDQRQKNEQRVLMRNQSYFTYKLTDLSANVTYLIWVRAYSHINDTTNSDVVQVVTFPEPENITLVDCTAYMMNVSWKFSLNGSIETYILQYAEIISNVWHNVSSNDIEQGEEDGIYVATINSLKPKTQYKLRLNLLYTKYTEPYMWPSDSRFTYETLGDKPNPPGTPTIQHVQGKFYQVGWETPESNGAPIELYLLEAHSFPHYKTKRAANRSAFFYSGPYIEEQEDEWIPYYNGTETHWIITGLSANRRYSFRVSALNDYGWSDPSEESNQFDLNSAALLAEKQEQLGIILGISIPIMVSVVFCVIVCIMYLLRQSHKDSKTKIAVPMPRGPDVELATLRELPRRENFIHNTNVLYVSAQPTPDELALLPHIRRDQITLTKFLGSGAFGEVFEGRAKGVATNGGDMRVAVKTLRKGALDQEKTEFLQEAQLMSHFKHEHILQMLGVCLDNDPHFIIMELMEAGDLLTYLRSSRTTSGSAALTLMDLLSICVDVSKGCRYLEEMHFVHRDLACRNCLVSSASRPLRVVKIGDFGLARDIYKNDYYRKEGEGLLPVRWMAPESLVDGVFTCQSDVWAFGVLMWEIMTFGQQPYPARNNLEVLHFVRGGGRLGKPTNCPEDLYQLMLLCWSFTAEDRPTFKYCLEELEHILTKTPRIPLTAAHDGHYISTVPIVPNGVSNRAYFEDENHNNSAGSWKSEDGGNSRERVPFLQQKNNLQKCSLSENGSSTEIPKYLELLYDDSDCPTPSDGYEIPRRTITHRKLSEPNLKTLVHSVPAKSCENGSIPNNKNELINR